ncbi:MAG: PaaI family thioesterase [Bacteroidota bacterium]
MNDLTRTLFASIKSSNGKEIEMPPPAVKHLDPTFLEYVPGKSMQVSFPLKKQYNNPFGVTFGGYYGMFFDASFGPFSGMIAGKPTTSLDMNITFLKPLMPADKKVIVEVEVVSQSKSYLLLQAKAYKGERILVATATSRMLIMDR